MKRTFLTGCVLLTSIAGTSLRAAVAPEEAQKTLADKQAARAKARAEIVQITAGELEDLKAKISTLQAQLDAAKAGKSASVAGDVKHFDEIELGMTKAEVKAFVNQHSSTFSIVGITASAGISKQSSQVTVRESGQATIKSAGQAITRKGNEGDDLAGTGKVRQMDSKGNAQIVADNTRNVETVVNRGHHETMEIAKWTTVTRQTGTETIPGSFGKVGPTYGNFKEQAGSIRVSLDDDIVTEVVAHGGSSR